MQSSFPVKLEFDDVTAVDWYDGDVTAIVKAKGHAIWFFASLVSFDIESETRTFVLLPTNRRSAEQIQRLATRLATTGIEVGRDREAIGRYVEDMRNSVEGPFVFVRGASLRGNNLEQWRVDALTDEVRSRIGQDVEAALQASEMELR
jgi:hypothetical protein